MTGFFAVWIWLNSIVNRFIEPLKIQEINRPAILSGNLSKPIGTDGTQ
ncbi:hypothetical protein D1BOALGB6SA_7578 [Olavius sp. associated proteobacterium Delta 1]|nr:hypothetical protein D1BOALGB6SA_7578 [Olavius sp. associated proteobacterium Delta 1]